MPILRPSDNWLEQLHAGCFAYIQLGLESESLLQVMIRPFSIETYPELSKAAHSSFEHLQTLLEKGQESNHIKEGDSAEMAAVIWSMLQGVTTILIGEMMPKSVVKNQDAKQLTQQFVNQMLAGLK